MFLVLRDSISLPPGSVFFLNPHLNVVSHFRESYRDDWEYNSKLESFMGCCADGLYRKRPVAGSC